MHFYDHLLQYMISITSQIMLSFSLKHHDLHDN